MDNGLAEGLRKMGLLFALDNRADLIAKLPRSPADCYVIDLGDGTADTDKAVARTALKGNVAALRQAQLQGLITFRVNEPGSAHHAADLEAAWARGAESIVIPKPGSAADLQPTIDAARIAGRPGELSSGSV